ncbi:MAG: M1 family metallopeptidase [Myxococcota bacterium]|nr:M1 family metallopeptidase [Myxococcota bacterium]
MRTSNLHFVAMLACATLGCGHIHGWLAADSAETKLEGLGHDLSAIAVPLAYTLNLDIDPRQPGFRGQAVLGLEIQKPSDEIRLHAVGLSLESAQLSTPNNRWRAKIRYVDEQTVALAFNAPIPAGPSELSIEYRGAMAHEPKGLFRVKEQSDWYSYTQFSPHFARHVFPCIDQPGFKTPVRLTLTVPKSMTAVANAPLESKVEQGRSMVFRFKSTLPLPIYLVAFAVGPLDYWPSVDEPLGDLRTRILTTRGKSPLARFAADIVQPIYDRLKSFVRHPYPYPKLDLIAVPAFAHGGMENAGLVTMRENLLLHGKADTTPTRQLWTKLAIAHELAHSYFGNAVSPNDWHDRWLGEGLSTWLAQRIVTEEMPAANLDVARAAGLARLLRLDRLHQPTSLAQSDGVVDEIKQAKGAAIIHMVSHWLGAPSFRRSIQRFLKAHAHGTAQRHHFIKALDSNGTKRVGPVLNDFVEKPGFPVLEMRMTCRTAGAARVSITLGATPCEQNQPQRGHIPVCVGFGVDGDPSTRCFVVSKSSQTFELPGERCPTWLYGNAHQSGYYSWYSGDQTMSSLMNAHAGALSPSERAALPESLLLHLETGRLTIDEYMASLDVLSGHAHRYELEGVISGLRRLSVLATAQGHRKAFAPLVRGILGPHLKRFGLEPKVGEDASVNTMRRLVLFPLAFMGDDPTVDTWATAGTERFLQGKSAVSGDRLLVILPIAARHGDDDLWQGLADRLAQTEDPIVRIAILRGLGSFEDPRLFTKSLDLVLNGQISAAELISVGQGVTHATRDHAWMWMSRNYTQLAVKLGHQQRAILPWLSRDFCTASDQKRVKNFFQTHRKDGPMGRELNRISHRIEQCIAFKNRVGPAFLGWLTTRAAKNRP